MTDRADPWMGKTLMAVRLLDVEGSSKTSAWSGDALELVWDDRSAMVVYAKGDSSIGVDGARKDPEEPGRWVTRNVSLTAEFGAFIGQTVTGVTWNGNEENDVSGVDLAFGESWIRVRPGAVGISVETEVPTPRVSHGSVTRPDARADDLHHLYYEVVDGVLRRSVEVLGDGRRRWTCALIDGEAPRPHLWALGDVTTDFQYGREVIAADQFEVEWRGALTGTPTTTLWRPTGPRELELVRESGWRRWPPRLADQPIFDPVTSREYAERIAHEWNVPNSGVGYVTRFEVVTEFMDRYAVHEAGGSRLTEWWVPAEDLDYLNDHIVGEIEVVLEVRG